MQIKFLGLSIMFLFSWNSLLSQTNVSGNQSGTWTLNGSPYLLVGNVTIPTAQNLTIEPGVEIQFSGGQVISISGTLSAVGTETDSIYFIKNPSSSGYGGRLSFTNTSSPSNLNYCVFDSLGFYSGTNTGMAIYTQTSQLNIEHCRISNSEREGIRVNTSQSPTIKNTLIENHSFYGINILDNATPEIDFCEFENNNDKDIYTYIEGVGQLGELDSLIVSIRSSSLNQYTFMPALGDEGKYALENSISIGANDTLQIEAGAKLLFNVNTGISISGTLLAEGTVTDSIYFIKNPSTNDYGGVLSFSNINNSISQLQHCVIDSMGYYSTFTNGFAISAGTSALEIEDSRISNSEREGIRVQASRSPTIRRSFFYNNPYGGINILDNATPIIDFCHFENNDRKDIRTYIEGVGQLGELDSLIVSIRSSSLDQYTFMPALGDEGKYALENSISIGANDTLQIEAGAKLLFNVNTGISISGTLLAEGTATDSIYFIKNPSTNDYGGVLSFSNINNSISQLQHCVIDSLGYYSTFTNGFAISAGTSALEIEDSRISNSEREGIRVQTSRSPTIRRSFFYNNPYGGINILDNATPEIDFCEFENNNDKDIYTYIEGVGQLGELDSLIISIRSSSLDQYTFMPALGDEGKYALENSISIGANDTLQIEAGAKLLFNVNTGISISGTLLAEGTATDSIYFIKNPSTNDYGGVLSFSNINNSISQLQHCVMDSLGYYSTFTNGFAISASTSALEIEDSRISNSEREGIRVQTSFSPTIKRSFFNNNLYGGINILYNATPIIDFCHFENNPQDIRCYISSLNNIQNNNNTEINVLGETLQSNALMPYPGTNSYYKLTSDITLAASTLLSIEPGVLMDFSTQNVDLIINGTLQAIGSELNPIQFVRLDGNDNNYGGNINITSNGSNSSLSYVNLDHLGNTNSYALNVSSETTSLGNINITNSKVRGLQISDVSPTIVNSTFTGQDIGIYVTSGSPIFTNCSILGNTSFGINNVGIDTVDARESWWGDVSGPFHSTNTGGFGNQVSDRVLFNPILNEPPNNTIVNLGLVQLLEPTSDCNLTDNTPVVVELVNFGNITQANFDIGIIVNEVDTIIENVSNINLLPGQSLTYTFMDSIDLSAIGNYDIKVFVFLGQDSIPTNDTLSNVVINYPEISSPGNLVPNNGSSDLDPTINFSWSPSELNPTYNFYLWDINDSEPTQPTFPNLSQINKIVSSPYLEYGRNYRWKVEAMSGNCISTSVTQDFSTKEYPDIIVQTITTPNTSFSGQNIQISWETKNIGNGSSGSNIWYDAVYFSNDSIYDGTDTYLGAKPNIAALMAGESYINDLLFTIPQGLQGNFYIIVRSDFYNNIIEANNGNNDNAQVLTTTLTPPPDLVVETIITPNNAFSEQDINVSWTVKNDGTGPTINTLWDDRIYISTDPVFNQSSATNLKLVSHNNVSPLEKDSSYTKSTTVTLPQGIFGDYYIHLVTDHFDDIYEYVYENNNVGTSSIFNVFLTPPPDLAVTSINIIDSISYNKPFLVQWEVINQGANSAIGTWNDRIYVSSLDTFNSSFAINLSDLNYPTNLASGEDYSAQRIVTMPDLDADTCYIYVVTDITDNIYEFNEEANNILRSDAIRIQKSDLEVTALNIPTPIYSGEELLINYTIFNSGEGNIINKYNRDRIYYSDVFPFDASNFTYLTANDYYLTLSAQQDIIKQKSVSIPNGISGNKYFYIITDYQSDIIEVNENNNITSQLESILLSPTPDLIVSNIGSLPDSILAGTTIPFDFSVFNQGTANATGNTWLDQIYVSVDSIWNQTSAVKLKEVERLQSLTTNSSYQVNTDLTFPMLSLMVAGLDSFSYVYLYVVTDAEDTVYEEGINNDNNVTRSQAIHVTCPPPVDLNLLSVSSIEDSLLTGEEVSITWMVQNIGSTTAYWNYPLWYDGFFLSLDTIFDSGDIFIEDFTIPGPLDNGAFYSETQSIQIPSTSTGNYYLLMVADHQDRNNDADRSNNTKVIPVTSNGNTGGSGTINIVQTAFPDLKAVTFSSPPNAISGQPFDIIYSIQNVGDTILTDSWTDKIYLSTDNSISNSDQIISSTLVNIDLQPGEIFSDTIQALSPVNQSGNRILLFKTDANHTINEAGSEANNIVSSTILLNQSPPADLIVSNITELDTIMVNEEIDLQYEVQNIGQNPANGFRKDVVYLSQDSLFDIRDFRVGIKEQYSNLSPQAIESSTLSMVTTPGVPIGDYHIIVQADAQNNINEIEENNNLTVSNNKVHITVPSIPLETLVNNTLDQLQSFYYKIEIPSSLIDETLLITLLGDSLKGNNEIYLSYEEIPSRANHDFAFENPFSGNQRLIVPELESGTYYLLIYGQHDELATQNISVKAEIIEFFIQSIEANAGGNTGTVTTKIKGARFEEGMEVKLKNALNEEIIASTITINNSTLLFATFNLNGSSVGIYDLIITKNGNESSSLQNAFTVEDGAVGSFGGNQTGGFFCEIENSGVENLLSNNIIAPASVRINRVVPITILFGNSGNIDIPCPSRLLISLRGAPLALSTSELDDMKQELFLEFNEINGPPGILRPGAVGSITIYTYSSHPLRFVLTK